MNIQVQTKAARLSFPLPTRLIFSRNSARLIGHVARQRTDLVPETIPLLALDSLFAEIRRIKKQYGRFDLIEVERADGTWIKIRL